MLICGNSRRARETVGLADLGRSMRPAVQLQNPIVEVLDPQAQPGDAHLPNHFELVLGQRARLALERDLLGIFPRRQRGDSRDQALELLGREERRRSASEIDEVQRSACNRRLADIQLPFTGEHVEVAADFLRVLVGVNTEVAEVASLPAEGNVQVQAEGHRGIVSGGQRRLGVAIDGLRRPDRKRRVGGDEVAADLGLIEERGFGRLGGHLIQLYQGHGSAGPAGVGTKRGSVGRQPKQ